MAKETPAVYLPLMDSFWAVTRKPRGFYFSVLSQTTEQISREEVPCNICTPVKLNLTSILQTSSPGWLSRSPGLVISIRDVPCTSFSSLCYKAALLFPLPHLSLFSLLLSNTNLWPLPSPAATQEHALERHQFLHGLTWTLQLKLSPEPILLTALTVI